MTTIWMPKLRYAIPVTRLCGECTTSPAKDQRSKAHDSRCNNCQRNLKRAAKARAKRKEIEDADSAPETVYEVQGSAQRGRR